MISDDQIIAGYGDILRRRPESAEAIAAHRSHQTISQFHDCLRTSSEYQLLMGRQGERLTLADLDAFIAQADLAKARSPDEFRTFVDRYWFDLPASAADPGSAAYRQHQMETYETIALKGYSEDNEALDFDLERAVRFPYPYNTQSAAEVSTQLIAIGSLIRAAQLAPLASVLELGIGWGNTAFHLARMGHPVLGLDIEPKYAQVVAAQARSYELPIRTQTGSFYEIERIEEKFDAVLFFEAFHHAHDHLRLLKAIPRILNPGGKLILAGEPVEERLPYPWGLNVGGIAVYCIRKYGWMELCFRDSYLVETLKSLGWTVTKHDCSMTSAGVTYVCCR